MNRLPRNVINFHSFDYKKPNLLFISRFTQTQNTICGSGDEIEKVFSYLFGTLCDAGAQALNYF